MQNTFAAESNRNPALSRNTGISGAVHPDEIILGRGSASPGRRPDQRSLSPQRNSQSPSVRRNIQSTQQQNEETNSKPVCPIWVFAILGLIGLAAITLGILFGFGIIGGINTPFQNDNFDNGTLVNGIRYHNNSILIETTILNSTANSTSQNSEGNFST